MKKYRSHKKPSDKQLKVIALLQENPEMTLTEAGTLAGYSKNTVRNISKNVLNRPIVKSLLDNYRYELSQHNINPARLALKLDQLLDARDPIVTMIGPLKDKDGNIVYKEDRKSQLGAMKLLHDVYGVTAQTKDNEGLKKRITLEEFEEKEGIAI